MILRSVERDLQTHITGTDHKIFFLWGPRRSGKTTLLEKISVEHHTPIFNFDLLSDQEKFIARKEQLEALVQEHRLILIDEIQNYPQSTVALKILHDVFKVKVIATGSSELRQKAHTEFDTLADRFTERFCLPLSLEEIEKHQNPKAYEQSSFHLNTLAAMERYGNYPEIFTAQSEQIKIDLLQTLLDTYVLKDVINIYDLKNTKLAKDILTKIALQLGSEVSLRELASSLGSTVTTVANYIEIFVKNYILIQLPAFKTNARRAVSAHRKLYFFDLGLRNILIKDFRLSILRPDSGGVFESMVIAEIEKLRRNYQLHFSLYFYREYSGKEVDVVLEDYQKRYICIEIKRSKQSIKSVFPHPHTLIQINPNNMASALTSIQTIFGMK